MSGIRYSPQDAPNRSGPRTLLPLLGALFLLSGAAGLVYEVIWFRLLYLELGGTGLSVAAVTAAFMGGLGVGAWLFGTRLARRVRPIHLFAALEAAIGLYALLVPRAITLALGLAAGEHWPQVFRVLVAGAVLLPATVCMGGTLPALSRLVEQMPLRPGRFVGLLYGLNTTGAVLGAGAAGFVLMPALGTLGTLRLAAGANLLLAAAAWGLARWAGRGDARDPPRETAGTAPRPALAVAAYTASGVIAFVLQVSWTRILVLTFGSSVHAFSLILAIFLLGLGLGAAAGALLSDRLTSPVGGLSWCFVLAGAAALLGQGLYPHLPGQYLEAVMETGGLLAYGSATVLAAGIVLPATLMLGAGFPLAVRVATGDARPQTGARVGWLYAGNSAGAVVAAVTTALVLIPTLGLAGSVSLAGLLALFVGVALALARPRLRKGSSGRNRGAGAWGAAGVAAAAVALWLAVVPGWNRDLMALGAGFLGPRLQSGSRDTEAALAGFEAAVHHRLLYYRDGVTATVAVKEEPGRPPRWPTYPYLLVDGKGEAGFLDLSTHVLLGQLPMLAFAGRGAEVLVIGHGSGVTAGSVLTHPVESMVVVEIEDAVLEASHFFDETNGRPLEDRRTLVVVEDARAYLRRTPRRFDVIISQPSSAWTSGPARLFTREAFELARSRLEPGGILCQWVQTYDLDTDGVFTLLRTMREVFPETLVFEASRVDLLLLASEAPIRFQPASLTAAWSRPGVQADLRRAGIGGACGVLDRLVAETGAVDAALTVGPLNTDDNALLEYRGPAATGRHVGEEVVTRLLEKSAGAAAVVADLSPEGPVDPGALALSCLGEGATRAAASLAHRKLQAGPDADALWVLGEIDRKRHQRTRALSRYEAALAAAADHGRSLMATAMTLDQLGRRSAALAAWTRAGEVLGESREILFYRGVARLTLGDAPGALGDLERARKIDGPELPLDLHAARALLALEREDDARGVLESYLAGLPEAARPTVEAVAARTLLAQTLSRPGNEAYQRLLAARAGSDRRRLAGPILDRAYERLVAGGETEARPFLGRLVELDPALHSELLRRVQAPDPDAPPQAPRLRRLIEDLARE